MSEGSGARRPERATSIKILISIGLLAATFGIFGSLRNHDFVSLDDVGGIQYNADLAVSTLDESLRNAFTRPLLSNWIPVTALSHQLDRKLYGANAAGHLLTNVALHAGASILLFWALSAMTGAIGRSAFVAAVFAAHPLHVETVAWVSERKGVLSGFFFMLALMAYAGYARQPDRGGYLRVLAALALALLSKPTTVTLPCVFLLLDFWPLRRLDRRAVLEKLPMLALVVAASAATFLVQRSTDAMSYGSAISLPVRVENAVSAYGVYLVKSFWPAQLAVFYAYPVGGPSSASIAFGAGALLLGTIVSVRLRATHPYLLVGWLWFVGMLVPMIGLVQVGEQSHADRYMYLPLIGLSIALTWALRDLARSAGGLRFAAAGSIALLAVASWHQVGHWRDGWSLWRRVLEVNPGNARAIINLGTLHARRLEFEEAEAHFLSVYSAGRDRDREVARKVLRSFFLTKASYLRKQGDADGELESYGEAARYAPGDPDVQRRLGLALSSRGRGEEARPYLAAALTAEPADVRVLLALSSIAEASHRHADAVRLRREVMQLAPTVASNINDLAWLLATAPERDVRDPAEAVRLAESLVAGRDPSANLLDTLGASYGAAGRFEEAVATTTRALALAQSRGDSALAAAIQKRHALYRAGRPFVESGG
jgi:tetratricopeptide (TPR) repeat protein